MSEMLNGLRLQREAIFDKMDNCWRISEYQELKKSLGVIEEKIAALSGDYARYMFVKKINERIDELETNRAKKVIEKQKCGNIKKYRKLIDNIAQIDEAIQMNKEQLFKVIA